MSLVLNSSIDLAWSRVGSAVADGRTQELMDQLAEAQPNIMAFLLEASSEVSPDASDLLFHGVLVIWNSYLNHRTGKDTLVSQTRIFESLGKAQKWAGSLSGDGILLQKKLTEYSKFKEPNLMSYVIDSVFESGEDGLELELHEQRVLLILLAALVSCF
jgi:hypothetical protein